MATIADVASHAGVSMSTVSYVLSGKRPISEETRQRVEEAIRELGYRPHAGARALASSDGGGADSSEVAAASPRRPRRSDAMFYSLLVEVQVSGTANDMAAPLTRSYDGQKHSLPLNPSESPGSVNVPAVVAHAVCCRLVM